MTQSLSIFQDRVSETISDLEGQDEMFYHDAQMRTIVWWIGRVKTIAAASAGIKGAERRKFIQAVAEGYKKMPERRIYEALAVYQKFSKPSDSLKETCERIFQEAGSWSKALPSGKREEVAAEPPEHTCNFICPKCGNQYHP
jgi:hypothetical protein